MPTKSTTKKQARAQKSAIKKLRDLGIIKADLRRKPTPATKRALKKYADVVSGRAAVLKVKNPRVYRKTEGVRVAGKNVIVPRRKGEKISIDKKSGRIVHKRKIGGKIVTSKSRVVDGGVRIGSRTPIVIPFAVGNSGRVEYFRFATEDALHNFLDEYEKRHRRKYKNRRNYILVEDLEPGEHFVNPRDEDEKEERNARLDDLLEARLAGRRRAREQKIFEKRFAPPIAIKPRQPKRKKRR